MASVTTQWTEDDQTSSDSFLEEGSDRVWHIIDFRAPTISPFAIHHCAHVIFLRAQQATSKDPAEILMLAAKSKQVGQLAESVLKILASMPILYIADGENIFKKLPNFIIDRIYEELLSEIGTPFDLMEEFYAGDKMVETAFALAILKALDDEDLEMCIFNPRDTDSLCGESQNQMTDESIQNSTSIAMLLLLKLLANGPPYTVHLDKPPQELMNTLLNLWTEALREAEANNIERLYKKLFIDHHGQISVEKLFHMKFGEQDSGFYDDVTTEFTDVTSMTTETDSEVSKKPKKKSWLSRFNIFRIFRKCSL
ncbi:hypothetical protein QTP70_007963 [Hemibagrus guttatus]|uniref:Uncharacterized protein n=1 Tax=Hemibagrus guttatus TaxID=175788 RepID=A0AAE0PRZ6_9TELE|nr:hypothetical protein QTP70_007963 [Hemibagrus guttatus]